MQIMLISQQKFNNAEQQFYLAVWISSVFYALYAFQRTSADFFHEHDDFYEDFQPGWSIFGARKKDKADFEWETISYFTQNILPHIFLYLIVSEAFTKCYGRNTGCLKVKSLFHTLWTSVYFIFFQGYIFTFLLLFQPVFFSIVSKIFKSKTCVWICTIFSIFCINYSKEILANETVLTYLKISHFQIYLNILALCWMNLKCTFFHLIYSHSTNRDSYLYFSYCLYFPTLFTGPFLSYEDFLKTFAINEYNPLNDRIKQMFINLARCVFWMVFTHVALHFVFANATTFQPELVKNFNIWQLCGYGYAMGQFFHLKYVILYGLTTSAATFENISVPTLPRCIGRVHLYSDMWKFFDPGLYQFLKRCIYIPTRQRNFNKLFASFLCFTFVFLWHGTELYILIWAVLNFLGVCSESVARNLFENRLKKVGFVGNLSPSAHRRLANVFAAPLLIASAISNFYFFAGKEIGDIFVQKIFQYGLLNQTLLLFVMYCCCQVSTELRDVKAHS